MGTQISLSSARQQQTDGQAERVINVVEEILRTGVNYEQNNWVELLASVEFSINNSVAAAHGLTPFFVEEARHPFMPLDVGALRVHAPANNKNKTQNSVDPASDRSVARTADSTHGQNGLRRSARRHSQRRAYRQRAAIVQSDGDHLSQLRGVDAVSQALATNASTARATDARIPAAAQLYVDRVVAAHLQAADMLQETRLRMCQAHDARARAVQYACGDKIWLSASGISMDIHRERPCQNLTPVYYGPYEIVEQISAVSYRLKLPSNLKIHDVFHVQRLKPATDDEFKGRRPRPMPALRDSVYEVEEIVNHKVVRGKEHYLIRWKGYSMNHMQWLPLSELSCPRLLRQYRELRKKNSDD